VDDRARRFGKFAATGIFFQGGAAAIDTGTIVATLVHGLTGGSAVAVGAAATIARAGWLLPQLIVGYVAQRRARRMPFYVDGYFLTRHLPCRPGRSAVARDTRGRRSVRPLKRPPLLSLRCGAVASMRV
jgi:hypothetical protein